MKKMKKVLGLLLALVLAMSMAMTAFAAPDTFTIKLAGTAAAPTTGHEYTVYQIFTGELSYDDEENSVLSNVKYGANYGTEGAKVADEVLEGITDADAFAKEIVDELHGEYGKLNAGNNWTLNNVPAGYYLIVDTTANLPEGHERSRYIVEVVENVEIAPKAGVLEVIKKVDDKNDTTGAEDDIIWHDSADHDLGDMIDFKIDTTLPDDLMSYNEYELTLHDTQSLGLTFHPETVKVYVDNVEITTGFEVVTSLTDGCTFEVRFADVTELAGVKNGSVITVRYQSELNANAVIGSLGNPNEVYGEYSNDYYPTDNGKTPVDRVIVFTYKVNVDKYKEEVKDGNELTGAGFTLYKEVPAGTAGATLGSAIKEGLAVNVNADALKDDSYYITIAVTETDAAGDTFGFKHIDDGTYVLVETTVPTGYNSWDSVEFVITAKHDVLSDNPQLTELTGGDLFTGNVSTGVLDTNIINNSGTELPETGGMGTTMFYVIGAILAIGAAVVMITKKRMSAN